MLKPKYLQNIPENLIELYSQAEMDILADMARRISTYDYFIPAAQWQYKKMIEMGNFNSNILKTLSSMTGKTEKEIKILMQEAGLKALKFDDKIYTAAGLSPLPISASPAMLSVLKEGANKTNKLFKNLTNTTASTATKQFENALDRAYMQITSGAFDKDMAIRTAIKDLSRQGVQAVTYPTGHTDSIETSVRRAIVTGVNQTALKLQDERADQMDCDLVETTAHGGARPSHAQWQGKVFSRSGKNKKYPDFKSSTRYGTGEGLGGWNCRHSYYPFFEGLSNRAYTDKELNDYEAKKYTYNGNNLTEYEANKIQRKIERNIRRWKRENIAMKAANLDSAEASSKIKSWQEIEKDFITQTGLKKQVGRSQVGTYSHKEARNTTIEAEKYYKAWIGGISNKGNPENLAAYYDMKYNKPKEYAQLRRYASKVDSGMISPLCSFDNFKKQHNFIENQIIGSVTSNGIKITKQSDHFIERIIGTTSDPLHNGKVRNGVSVEDVKDALINGKAKAVKYTTDRNTGGVSPSQLFYIEKCAVSVNPENGILIQCNPRG